MMKRQFTEKSLNCKKINIEAMASSSKSFRERLVSNPKDVVCEELGISKVSSLKITLIEEQEMEIMIVLRHPSGNYSSYEFDAINKKKGSEELGIEDLDQVSGGVSSNHYSDTDSFTISSKLEEGKYTN